MSEPKDQSEAADGQSRLTEVLAMLVDAGCYPCVAYRGGGFWRAHINGAGNFWDDAKTPEEALNAAVRLWDQQGRPIDGYGSMANAYRRVTGVPWPNVMVPNGQGEQPAANETNKG